MRAVRHPHHLDSDRERLGEALWRYIHPDLADTDADPYRADH